MDNQEITKLLERYDQGQCTEKERAWVETWYLNQPETPLGHSIEELAADLDEVERYLIRYANPVKTVSIWPRFAGAAVVLLVCAAGAYFLMQKEPPKSIPAQAYHPISPGGNKAILKLSDGRQISLTDSTIMSIAEQGGQTIKKTADGTIAYQRLGSLGQGQTEVYNTMSTPKGGQWSVVLPDGTKVKLDAASTLRYPLAFGEVRQVEVSGQAYFEVVHHGSWPFRVITKDQVIEDIGTAFNVNAYPDEPITKTALVEGAVAIFSPRGNLSDMLGLTLRPGEQAVSKNDKTTVSAVNIDDAIAWKNGYFRFSDENIESVMRKLSRWYDLDVEYQGSSSQVFFKGEIPRSTSLANVIKVLDAANIHLTVAGKKIIVKD